MHDPDSAPVAHRSGAALAADRTLQPRFAPGTTLKIVGGGGVGGILARHLALFAAAQKVEARLVILDGDAFEPGNATRMLFGRCGNKAAVLREELLHRFGESQLALEAIEEFVSPDNIGALIREGDHVFLTVDNHATRRLVSQHCGSQLRDVCLISGGNDGIEPAADGRMLRGTFGNVQVYLRQAGADVTPSLTQFHPEIERPRDRLPTERSCTELLASVPQILFANLTVAAAMLNTYWLHLCGALHYSELVFDIAEGIMRPAPLPGPATSAELV